MTSQPTPRPLIGLLGGVGARASAKVHQRLMERRSRDRQALWDEDFPSVLHYSAPIPGLLEVGVVDEKLVLEHLMTVMPLFKLAKVSVLAPVCNSLHPYRNWMQWATGAKVITPVDATMGMLRRHGVKEALVLQSRSLAEAGVYRDAFAQAGIRFVEVSDDLQTLVDGLIASLIAGCDFADEEKLLAAISQSRPQREPVVLGCTELGLWPRHYLWPSLDSSECLVEALLAEEEAQQGEGQAQ